MGEPADDERQVSAAASVRGWPGDDPVLSVAVFLLLRVGVGEGLARVEVTIRGLRSGVHMLTETLGLSPTRPILWPRIS